MTKPIIKTKKKIERYGVDFADTGLDMYHKDTMKYLLELNIIEYVEKPANINLLWKTGPTYSFTCTLTIAFCRFLYSEKQKNKDIQIEKVIELLAEKNGIKLKKKLIHDMTMLLTFVAFFDKEGEIWIK